MTWPSQVLISGVTYVWTDEGWLCLAAALELFPYRSVL